MKKESLENHKRWILQEKYKDKLTKAAQKDIARLEKGEPVDYIIGWVDFLGCTIDLSEKPLIPRVETEFWTEKLIEEMKDRKLKVLDMFAGSGCIGLAFLKYIKNAHVTFVDSEKNFIEQIKINIKRNRINHKRCKFILSDVFNGISQEEEFDVIVANPPYIPTKNKHKVQKSVLQYEPHSAMFGGGDGLFFIRKFLAQAKDFLAPGGVIYMEFNTPQKPAIAILLKKLGYKHWEFHKDQFNRWRWVRAIKWAVEDKAFID